MLYAQGAIIFALALVTRWSLSIMTMHAVVISSSTMIGRDIATEVALVLNVGLFVFVTIRDAKLTILILTKEFAFGTLHVESIVYNKASTQSLILLSLKPSNVLIISACSKSSKVSILASKALVIIEVIDRKLFQIIKVFTLRIGYSFVKI